MKKQSRNLKLNKSVISELSIDKANEVKGGKTGAQANCVSVFDFRPCFTQPCEASVGC